ncbi:MAG: HemN-like radical SAM family enzyme [Roseibaca calidilacus]|uniref:Heme chaperone HemW n=1 Tax=Roseibaca calidilacus TaxID=1666912 RepID=A0A0N8K778_9RHOB|nr:radical SAM family heme chaperone HemW [Roseibaca calidilacus]KPP90977.1 MAG: HemN-like radical SAM family enzyme [Roseibaca calidilacus]CUX83910.1 oxygen-independent coproporphyrinogen-3 oxidase [Roseibaca calidilacus]
MDDWQNGGFGLYVHWPFCQAKCPYCDFNSHVSAHVDQSAWARAYLSEIDRLAAETGPRVLNTIFFGGGTPSLMNPELVAAIIDRARARWPAANDLEVTLEANPTSVEAGRFRAYAQGGVNRVSVGIQALNDADLKRLGRMHSVAEGRKAFDIARDAFARVSFDLIYARQYQTLAAWEQELTEALSMAVDHLSLYQLTIEPGTAFGARAAKGGLHGLPDDDIAADMYLATQDICDRHGLLAYEVSNHAKPGAQSRHNLIYWRYGDYAGIGPGAHGRLTLHGTRWATQTPLMPNTWLNQVNSQACGEAAREAIPPEEQALEHIMMGLRLNEGLDMDRFTRLNGAALPQARIDSLAEQGLVTVHENRLTATPHGRAVLNGVLRELLT